MHSLAPALRAAAIAAATFLVTTGPTGAQPADARLPPPVAAALKAVGIPQGAVALHIQEAGGTAPLVSFNAGQPLNPASVMKLVTTYAALEALGPAHTWKTEARTEAPLIDGVLAGDLFLSGSGDPKLTFEQFWLLLRQLRALGIRDIAGDLVLDRSLFALPDQDPAAFDAQPLRPYNVAPDALLVGFKTVRLGLRPETSTKTVAIVIEPPLANLDLVNLVRLGNNGCGDWKEALRADLAQHGERYRLVLTGTYSAACGQRQWHLGVLSHEHYVYGLFAELWRELGGSLRGGVRSSSTPAAARSLAQIESPSLAEVVRDINKFSNNVMARQLYLTLGTEGGQRSARPEDADAAVRRVLEARGLRFPEMVIENGSGLSRRERISAESLGRLLQAAWRGPLMPEFMASLPLTAVDGTMKKRLNGNGAAGQAHIKTGTLEGVKTIAGYVLDRHGHRLAVVFLLNHPNAQAGQPAQDALLQWIYEGGAK